jgi:glycosyltransferase involved in cell wall biosynthesis
MPVSADDVLPIRRKLTIIIPCYNERATIAEIIRRVKELPVDASILVVDNCSTDGTRELLRSSCTDERALVEGRHPEPLIQGQAILRGDGYQLVLQPRNFSKGTSVRLGLALANSEYVVCQDADLEYEPRDILRLLESAERTGAVALFGSRLTDRSNLDWNAFQFGRVALTVLFRMLFGTKITDVATCYKLMRTDVVRELGLRSSGFDLDFEIAARLRRRGHAIAELAVEYHPRTTEQGKKIRWRDGLSAAWVLLKTRIS